MISLKYLINGAMAAVVCIFGIVLMRVAFPELAPDFMLFVVAPSLLCFFVPPFVTTLIFGGKNSLNDGILGVIIAVMAAFSIVSGPWFFYGAFIAFSMLGGWLGRRVRGAKAP